MSIMCDMCYNEIRPGDTYVKDRYSGDCYCIECVHIKHWDVQDRRVA